jgi:protein tyrosine phosphatase (PTP) superfamily phosphohydrolase (DUF442 family)
MTPHRWLVGITLFVALVASGCEHCCKKRSACPPPCTGGPPGPIMGNPNLGNPNLPPQNISPYPPSSSNLQPEVLLPTNPPTKSSYVAPAPTRNQVVLGEPEFKTSTAPAEPKKPLVVAPPAAADEQPSSPLPAGIAGFAQVKDGVSNGLRPHLDGIDWLKAKGYKNVVFLRSGKEDDSSDRKQFENRGLKYQSLTIAPATITPTLVMEFNRLVNDADSRPIFVYDVDGKRAGAMWYLYFRTSELLDDDQSRVRAGRFGLKDKSDVEQTQLWTAVQKYLSERDPSSER